MIAPTHIPQLVMVQKLDSGVSFGAATILATIDEVLKEEVSKEPGSKVSVTDERYGTANPFSIDCAVFT